jgi:hypothetical protein
MATLLGPQYDYSGEMKTPSSLGIRMGDGSWSGITNAAAGVNFYGDTLGYGDSSGFAAGAGMRQNPLGLKFFIKTGGTCSNGAAMYDYINTVPNGVQGRLGNEIKQTMGVNLQGLAPGILEDAVTALNPIPMFDAMIGSGYARCKKITLPVGDINGALKPKEGGTPWIDPATVAYQNGKPYQSRWVFDSWISADEYNATPKTNATEGFCGGGCGCGCEGKCGCENRGHSRLHGTPAEAKTTATLLFGALVAGLVLFQMVR